jgi:ribosomal protein S17E
MIKKSEDLVIKVAKEVVDGYKGLNPDVRQEMIKETAELVTRRINAEFIARMDNEQVTGFSDLLDSKPTNNQVAKYISDCGINMHDAITTAVASFRGAYKAVKV